MKGPAYGHRALLILLLAGLTMLPAGGWTSPVPAPQDSARASALAQLGAQDAEGFLRTYFPFRAYPSAGAPLPHFFWGADQTEQLVPLAGTRPEDAVNPSFAVEVDGDPDMGSPAPRTLVIEGTARGISGTGAPTYAANGDHYSLKVTDLSGCLYVNDGVEQGPNGSVSQNMRRILNVLGDALVIPGLGDTIMDNRPAGGYTSEQQLLAALGNDQALFEQVREFVTIHAWQDPNVANPVPLSAAMLPEYPVSYYRGAPAVYRMGSSKDSAGNEIAPPGGYVTCPTACATLPHSNPAHLVYGLDTLNPQWIEIVSRAPVNVNAARREVLVALLSDLKGFFVADRRRNNFRWKGGLYLGFPHQNSLSPVGTEGDEYGFLMETVRYDGPGGATPFAISAYDIADEIIACRTRATTANENYNRGRWWEGPFKTWRQFNAFVDNLVAIGLIRDDRALHFDYAEESDDPTGYEALVSSPFQKQQAANAAADVLKANFNPNLHLNELNPDENLFSLVDKTDLFVNSTEFCFLPTGYFRVESVGRVVRPKDAAGDAFLSSDNELVAQSKNQSVVKLYDVLRETNQHQFYAGQVSAVSGVPDVNSGLSLELGPEPDNGVFPGNFGEPGDPDNEWSGYLALPTVGGVWHSSPLKAKNALVATSDLAPSVHLNASMHVHFTLDMDAHHHIIDPREIAGRVLPDESVGNYPDLGLAYGGPYDPTKGSGSPHRLCRSFRQAGGGSVLSKFAPSDLRIDGAYSERHAAPSYYVRNGIGGIWDFSSAPPSGSVSFWYKPSFFPELTGKVRKLWDMTRYHTPCASNVHVWPFEMLYMPTHYNPAFAETNQPRFWHNNMGQFHPSSMYFGSLQWHSDAGTSLGVDSHRFGKVTRSLNHIGHADSAIQPTVLRAHRWINTAIEWDSVAVLGQNSRMYINGDMSFLPTFSHLSMSGWNDRLTSMWSFETHSGGEFNQMRFGAPSQVAVAATVSSPPGIVGAYRGNHTADFTIDEIYVWQNAADNPSPTLQWDRGRYRNPDPTFGEGAFTSQPLSVTPAPSGSGFSSLLGVAWTWYGEPPVDSVAHLNGAANDPSFHEAVLYDWKGTLGAATGASVPPDLLPDVRVTGILDGAFFHSSDLPPAGEYNDGFAAVRSTGGGPVVIQDPANVKYVAEFSTQGALGAILLATPVLDDVTVYWNDGGNTVIETTTSVAVTGPSSPLPDGTENVVYATTNFTASGSVPLSWSTSGTLPPGMTLDAAGVYSGTPVTAGTYVFSATVTNPLGSETRVYSHTINAPGNPDTDGDGLPDAWEQTYFGNLAQGPGDDTSDMDGLTNLEEFQLGTNPTVADTDGDGLDDGAEVNTHASDPLDSDTDNDGLPDGDEVNTHGTDPTVADSDGDGMSDSAEVQAGFDPTDSDQDGNGTSDGQDDWDTDGTVNQFDLTPGSVPTSGGGGGGGGGGCGSSGLEGLLLIGIVGFLRRRR